MSLPDGVLVVDKPAGPTSHDIVARVRRHSAGRRVGHTGTLDPFASGVLPLCIGRATRLARFLSSTRKTYEGVIRLGVATDTYDSRGKVTARRSADGIDGTRIQDEVTRFRGTFLQTPPPFSARKLGGRPSYRLARQGKPVSLRPTSVTVHHLTIERIDGTAVRFHIVTSPGTYIRAIAHDLGESLGCGAHLAELRRLAAGRFDIADAHTMESILRRADGGRLSDLIVRMRDVDLGLPTVVVTPEGLIAMRSGRALSERELTAPPVLGDAEGAVRVKSEAGDLVGVAIPAKDPSLGTILRPDVVLVA